MSRIPPLSSRLLAVVPSHDYLWERVISLFAWLWSPIRWFLVAVLAGGLLVEPIKSFLTGSSVPNPGKWTVVQLILTYPYQAAVVFIFAIALIICTFLADRSRRIAPNSNDKAEYALKRVDRLDPHIYFFPYVEVYLPRRDERDGTDAEAAARKVLHQATTRTDDSSRREPLGICVFGRPTQGKTRFAWEAMRAELPTWMFVKWSPQGQLPFDFLARHRRGVVLWLDDLHKFANGARTLNDLPRRFAEAGISLRVVATCRDGDDETQAGIHFKSLLERLTEVRLADISPDEASQLVRASTQKGIEVQEEFDGTPGSLLLGVQRMRDERYPALPKPAQQVLKAMKLLYSAGIYTYPAPRVCMTAVDLFGLDQRAWRDARESLVGQGFVHLGALYANNERSLGVLDVYLERAISDYPIRDTDITDDWPKLQESLMHQHDADGLNSLGIALRDRSWSEGSAQFDRLQQATDAFRGALQVYTYEQTPADWAKLQSNLADTLSTQAMLAEDSARFTLFSQAISAYRGALQFYTREQPPDTWARIQSNLGTALHLQALLTEDQALLVEGLTLFELNSQAISAYRAALQFYTREQAPTDWARIQSYLVDTLIDQVSLAENSAQFNLLEQAIVAYRDALQFYTREQPPTDWIRSRSDLINTCTTQAPVAKDLAWFNLLQQAADAHRAALQFYTREQAPTNWAGIQNNLGTTLHLQALLTEDSARFTLFSQAADAYRDALQVYTYEQTPTDWARIQLNLAHTLNTQAMLAEGLTQFNLLQQAADAYRDALQVYTYEQAPADWAGIQNNLATIFGIQATLVESSARLDLFSQAIRVLQALLQVYAREKAPDLWARTQHNLAYTYLVMASLEDDANKRCIILREAAQYVEDALSAFTQEEGSEYYTQATQLYHTIKERMQERGCLSETEE